MCIRDSLHISGQIQNDSAKTMENKYQEQREALVKAGLKFCLLYTSDAADERSSVDLGGRRIIKKKTHTDISDSDRPPKENKRALNYY